MHETQTLDAVLRSHGYRVTIQRQLIYEAVCAAHGHITPDEICERVQPQSSSINRATVYRTLDFLCDIGLVTCTTAAGGRQVYELVAEQHHHLICRQCGTEITLPHAHIEPLLEKISAEYQFELVTTLHLTLFGTCAACKSLSEN